MLCGLARKRTSGGFDFSAVTMADLAPQLSAQMDRDIIDKTGITGVFDVHLSWTRPTSDSRMPPPTPPRRLPLATARRSPGRSKSLE